MGGEKARQILSSLGFSNWYAVDPIGYAGGIWFLLDRARVKVTIHGHTFQDIHSTVEVCGLPSFFASIIYASPNRYRRKFLWKNLADIALLVKGPWVVVGDLNEVMSNDEKSGVNSVCSSRICDFKACLHACHLTDVGYCGQKFTWCNKRFNGQLVFQRSDRFLGNFDWVSLFPDSVVHHLPRIRSDHNPILFSSKSSASLNVLKPFRCERVWLDQPDFEALVSNVWRENDHNPIFNILSTVKDHAVLWNKESFGNIFARKRRILARLEGINRSLAVNPNFFLENLQDTLSKEYQSVLSLEEELWAPKARLDWLNLGDANTKFFHLYVVHRRRSNRILCIKDNMGNWVEDPQGVHDVIVSLFKNLFSVSTSIPLPTSFIPIITLDSFLSSLDALPSNVEIKEALWNLKPFKAAGPDGFEAGFFQKNCNTVNSKVITSIKNAFLDETIPHGWNNTFICLIPKCPNPSEMKSFRPISLCSTLYKIVTKLLVGRLNPLIPSLISINQGAFVPGRKAIGNVVIAQ